MTGPEHYHQAEQLLAHECDVDCYAGHRACARQDALVHAMLALAAAFACARLGELPVWDADAWQDIAGTHPSPLHYGEPSPDLEAQEYDPGPEIDDEGGMSEYRHALPAGDS
jgi:hypothetical protein